MVGRCESLDGSINPVGKSHLSCKSSNTVSLAGI